MSSLRCVCCPYCGETILLERIGSVGELKTKPNGRLTCTHSKKVKCHGCGKTFMTEGATMMEMFGRDGHPEDQCF